MPTTVTRPFEGQSIRVSVPKSHVIRASWETTLVEWETATGAKAELIEVDSEPAYASDNVDKGTRTDRDCATDTAHLSFVTYREALDRVGTGKVGDLAKAELEEARLDWRDLFPGVRANVCIPTGKPSLVPISCPVLCLYYRDDLLKQSGLKPPATWDEYEDLIQQLDRWAPGLTVAEPWAPDFLPTLFLARAMPFVKHPANYSVFWDIESGEPILNEPGFAKALALSRRIARKLPASVKTFGPNECRREILEGRAALALAFENGTTTRPPIKTVRAAGIRIGISQLPGSASVYNRLNQRWDVQANGPNRVALVGLDGMCAVVSKSSSEVQAEAAWSLFRQVSGEALATHFPPQSRGACRESQLVVQSHWTGAELEASEAGAYVNNVAKSLRDPRVVLLFGIPQSIAYLDALRDELLRDQATAAGDAAAGGTTLETAAAEKAATEKADVTADVTKDREATQLAAATELLTRVAKRWDEVATQAGGRAKLRDAYRRSLGLTPVTSER